MNFRGKKIANFATPYVVAEIGANHNGDVDLARELIRAAKRAGCDCAKFQSWTKDSIFARQVYDENYFLADDYRDRTDHTLESIVDAYAASEADLRAFYGFCTEEGIHFASSPFSRREVDFLVDELDAPFIKTASMDCNNYDFLDYVARKGKPIVLSTGLSSLAEVDQAVRTIEEAGNTDIVLLHCVSVYPPEDSAVHLNNIDMLRANYPDYPVGFSDHTLGTPIPIAAIARGACLIEKHFTLDKEMDGWDHKVSATEDDMAVIVDAATRIPAAAGSYRRVVSDEDRRRIPAFRRSLVAARDIPSGRKLTRDDLDYKRPGTGFEPGALPLVVGRVTKRAIPFDKVLDEEDF